ncbi:MAG: DsrE/DsrF/DrsH-like family protein [Candidatus Micrarchaeaceae archaeon]
MVEKKNKFSIIAFSGTADKLIPLGVLAQAAAAMGNEVNIFVTGWALLYFTKKPVQAPFPTEFKDFAPKLMEGMKKTKTPSWVDMIKEAKSMGAKVYVCSLMAGIMGLDKSMMNDLVDDVVGAAAFLQKAEGGQTIFI